MFLTVTREEDFKVLFLFYKNDVKLSTGKPGETVSLTINLVTKTVLVITHVKPKTELVKLRGNFLSQP